MIISGSPTDGSSTDILLRRMADAFVGDIGDSHAVDCSFVTLNDKHMIPCQSCGQAPTPGWCFYEDEVTPLLTQLAECDCLIIGSPIYFDSVSAQLKLFIDRCNCFRPPDFSNVDPDHAFLKLIKRKRPGAMVLVGGEDGWFEGARRCIAGFFRWVEVTNEGTITFKSRDYHRKGAVIASRDILSEADSIGAALAGKVLETHAR
jgi:multimeric flavodoxin WrbA